MKKKWKNKISVDYDVQENRGDRKIWNIYQIFLILFLHPPNSFFIYFWWRAENYRRLYDSNDCRLEVPQNQKEQKV
jgi:hypothetical protein